MISSDEIHKTITARPFAPFQLELSSGERITVDNPALCLVFPLHVMLLRRNENSGRLEDYELVGIDHVAEVIQRAGSVDNGVKSQDGTISS